ncbi:MAG: nucleoside deaminase [Actinomycetota bacterium]
MKSSPPPTLDEVWGALAVPWWTAFEQAWQSWTEGNLGIGAVLVDPATGATVAEGRNQVHVGGDAPLALHGNFMAHAEMNAFAAMASFRADGLHLFTTLEPCFMCAATSIFLHVEHVNYAVADEYFDGMHDLWQAHPYPRRHIPERTGPLPAPLAAFARLLPLSAQLRTSADDGVLAAATEAWSAVVSLAREVAVDGTLEAVDADDGSAGDALRALWPRLPQIAPWD